MNENKISTIAIFFLLIAFFNYNGFSQNNEKSLAFKKNRPNKRYTIFYQPDLSYQIQQQFNLIKDANTGNPLAQHELGLRYLLGEGGFTADTLKGAYWVKKAAEQNLTAACYNYGILLFNGWGVSWDPFTAYDYFLKAANDGMPQAEYLVGIIHTDNLTMKKDYFEAYRWIKKSADQAYDPAIQIKKDLEKYLPADFLTSLNQKQTPLISASGSNDKDTSMPSPLGLVFIDFDAIQDTVRDLNDKDLINDLFIEPNIKLADTLGLKSADSSFVKVKAQGISTLLNYAESGNPEALTVLGKLYNDGIHVDKNLTKAAMYLVLASQLSFTKAKVLLLRILTPEFYSKLIYEVQNKNDEDAMFVFYGLWSLGLYNYLVKDEALKYLAEAADRNHLPSLVELGNIYYTGKSVKKDIMKAVNSWQSAAQLGNKQALIRLAAVNILDNMNLEPLDLSIKFLGSAVDEGSMLALITLAYANENGIGLTRNKAEAVKYYRLAAQRGNSTGFSELKRLYDEIRPTDSRFSLY